MFLKKYLSKKEIKKAKETNHRPSPISEYSFTIDYVNFVLKLEKSLEDKINMLDFFMEMIRKDIQYDLMSKFLYSEMDDVFIDAPIPITLMSRDPKEKDKAMLVRKDKIIDLSKDSIILLPWDRFRFSNTVKSIYKDKFVYMESNHKAYYYSDIDLCYVHSGNHSITTGIIKREGIIKAEEYDIKNLFKILTTDGLNWYLNGENYTIEVFDFRIAILYELAKIKHFLEPKMQKSI
ncbi:DUF6710 family protein [Tissierella praeacuta]|uniref:DUF6710 family protein n=1 Tax=Tissierella praeacuta TaxID=43131 RepID=UPI0028AFAD66|nr:DUF6710 family protein [Tissierella praeacuta]